MALIPAKGILPVDISHSTTAKLYMLAARLSMSSERRCRAIQRTQKYMYTCAEKGGGNRNAVEEGDGGDEGTRGERESKREEVSWRCKLKQEVNET